MRNVDLTTGRFLATNDDDVNKIISLYSNGIKG